MKKVFILVVAILAVSVASVKAQKMAFVDSEYILKHIPEYSAAQKQLDDLSAQWQKEVDKRYEEIDKLYKSYQAEQVLLTDDMRKKREQDIVDKEKAAKDFQKQKFGFEGELFQKRKDLIKPIQDKVYDAIQKVAEEGTLGMLFDKSGDLTMLYTNPKYDKSDDVVIKLGLKPGNFTGAGTKAPEKKGK